MHIYLHQTLRTIKMSPLEAEKDKNQIKVRRTYFEKYVKAGLKTQKPKFSVGDSVRIFKEHGIFHRGYKEDFTTETFIISKVLRNLPVVRYKLKVANGDEVVGSFFQDELVLYNPPEFYEIDVLKTKGKGKHKKFFVHYRGWPHTYDEWKKASEMKTL